MKWIGQHIWDTISRFRDDIYLEGVSSGTIASGGNLGLDSNNKIVKATVSGGSLSGDNYATDLKIGRDADNLIDFTTDNNIVIRANGENQLTLVDGALTPTTNAIVDLGTDALEFKDGYFDGTLEADAITIGGTALNTVIAGVTVTNATNSSHVLVTDNESTNEENLITFVEGATSSTGNVGLEMDGDLTYNHSTGTVTATVFKGNIDAVDGDFDGTLEVDNLTIGGAQGNDGQVLTSTGAGVAWEDAAGGGSVSGNTFATDLKIGRDADNLIDFTTDNQITFRVSAGDGVVMKASGEILLEKNLLNLTEKEMCKIRGKKVSMIFQDFIQGGIWVNNLKLLVI